MTYTCNTLGCNPDEHVSFNAKTKEISFIVRDHYHRSPINGRFKDIDTKDIDYVSIDRYLGYLEIYFHNGDMSGSRLTNFSTRDFRILERFERS